MKICVVQTRPVKGDIASNIENHITLTELAVSNGADVIIFPELSLTGYEPGLAKELSTEPNDSRFNNFQVISDTKQVTIGVGVPTKSIEGICISMIIFQPFAARQVYSKKYLHSDEEPFFISGQSNVGLAASKPAIALAICHELLVPEHAENAYKNGAKIYIASVAKSVNGIDKAIKRLAEIANKYSMTVLMSNSVGYSDGFECAGKTAIWNNKGLLIGRLNETNEGILIIDTETKAILEKQYKFQFSFKRHTNCKHVPNLSN